MTRLLVSVRDAAEAMLAVESGIGLIDFKDPGAGALGALDPDALREGLAAIGRRCVTSATTGDLPADPDRVSTAVAGLIGKGLDYVKVGLWPGEQRREVVARLGRLFSTRTRLIGVLLADADPDFELVPFMAEAGFAGAMLDLAGKGRSLPDVLPAEHLERFIEACRTHDLISGLAGSLRIAHISELAPLGPDVIGFRGGVCRGFDRAGSLDRQLVADAVQALRVAA